MSTIVLEADVANRLRGCVEPTVLHDPAGNVIGMFESPARLYRSGEVPEFDNAELDRRAQRWQGIPSSEARRQLEQMR